jgi:hypothetical protein
MRNHGDREASTPSADQLRRKNATRDAVNSSAPADTRASQWLDIPLPTTEDSPAVTVSSKRSVMELQRLAGNRAVRQVITAPAPSVVRAGSLAPLARMGGQAKLKVGAPNDPLEVEADRVAAAIVADTTRIGPVSTTRVADVQRKCTQCDEDKRVLQTKRRDDSSAEAPASLEQEIRKPAQNPHPILLQGAPGPSTVPMTSEYPEPGGDVVPPNQLRRPHKKKACQTSMFVRFKDTGPLPGSGTVTVWVSGKGQVQNPGPNDYTLFARGERLKEENLRCFCDCMFYRQQIQPFIYIKRPDQDWRTVNGVISGHNCMGLGEWFNEDTSTMVRKEGTKVNGFLVPKADHTTRFGCDRGPYTDNPGLQTPVAPGVEIMVRYNMRFLLWDACQNKELQVIQKTMTIDGMAPGLKVNWIDTPAVDPKPTPNPVVDINCGTPEEDAGQIAGAGSLAPLTEMGGQAKVKVGEAHDPLEVEADLVAAAIVADNARTRPISTTHTADVQRNCTQCAEDEDMLQTKRRGDSSAEAPTALEQEIRVASTAEDQPLDPTVRRAMEPAFGVDFARVRVHQGHRTSALADQLGARAFTLGHDVFFDRGEYQPSTLAGRRLIAHELTHVFQQGAVQPSAPVLGGLGPANAAGTPVVQRACRACSAGEEEDTLRHHGPLQGRRGV